MRGALVKLWERLKDKTTREVITWMGGGVVVVVSASWAVYTHFERGSTAPPPQVSATALGGGVAIGTMTGGNISTSPTDQDIRSIVAETLAQESPKQAQIDELSRALDIRDTTITGFFRTLEEKQVPP